MSKREVFQQETDSAAVSGGPFLIQLLFRKPVVMPDPGTMKRTLEQHLGTTECISHDGKMASFAARDYMTRYAGEEVPVQLTVLACAPFHGENIGAFERSQMWDCYQDRERILSECHYHVLALDMLAAGLIPRLRAELDMQFLEALIELFPSCEAIYFQNCGKLFLASEVREDTHSGTDRYVRFGVNVRFFYVDGTEDMVVDTVGMSTLFLPDLQYHFHSLSPNLVIRHAYAMALYVLESDRPVENGTPVSGMDDEEENPEQDWVCRYELSLIQPSREVIDIRTGVYAA